MIPIIFSAYLKKAGDDKNKVFLTNDKLVVVFKGKVQAFYRSNILKMSISRKKLIIALVAGGIGTSLSMIAMSMGWYERQLNLFIILVFFGIMYYGFVGKDALEIYEKGNINIYLLGDQLNFVKKFIGFFNITKSLPSANQGMKIYHIAEPSSWDNQLTKVNYIHESLQSEGFIHASFGEHLIETYQRYYKEGEELLLLIIIPELLENQLKYEWVEGRKADFPHVFGPINKSAVQSVYLFTSAEELKSLISI